jgi:hypothetical protein
MTKKDRLELRGYEFKIFYNSYLISKNSISIDVINCLDINEWCEKRTEEYEPLSSIEEELE